MSAWDKLLAASSLAIGTAWQLISSPRTGTGTGATVYVQAVESIVVDDTITSLVADDTAINILPDDTIISIITATDTVTDLSDDLTLVEAS